MSLGARVRATIAGSMALGVALLAACAPRGPSPSGGEAESGTRLFLAACASCHGVDARGDGPVAPHLREPVPDLTSLAARHGGLFPRQYVLDVIVGRQELPAHGTRDMPVWNERFGSGPGHVASWYARRRDELLADHLASLQRGALLVSATTARVRAPRHVARPLLEDRADDDHEQQDASHEIGQRSDPCHEPCVHQEREDAPSRSGARTAR